jgi:hypothetical protein
VEVLEELLLLVEDGLVEGRDALALAGDLGGDALGELAGRLLVDEQVHLRLPQHVDEARGDDQASGVEGALGCGVLAGAPHEDDAVADDAHVGVDPGIAAAVHHLAVADEHVILLRTGGQGQ